MKQIFISIIHFGERKNTIDCLTSLEHVSQKNLNLTVVVIDNAAKEQFSQDEYASKHFTLTIIQNKENLGFAGGHNVGIKHALSRNADYVLILNNDILIHKDLIDELIAVAEANDYVGIVAPKIYFAKGFEFHKERYTASDEGKVFWYAGGITDWGNVIAHHRGVDEVDHGQYDKTEKTDFASGCCMMVKKEVFKKVGMFDETYFLYYEDSDLCERVKRAKYAIMYAPKAVIWHKNAASAGGSGSELQDYYISRNRMLFGMRYAPLKSKIALCKESLNLLTRGRKWQKQGIIDFYKRNLGKGSYRI